MDAWKKRRLRGAKPIEASPETIGTAGESPFGSEARANPLDRVSASRAFADYLLAVRRPTNFLKGEPALRCMAVGVCTSPTEIEKSG